MLPTDYLKFCDSLYQAQKALHHGIVERMKNKGWINSSVPTESSLFSTAFSELGCAKVQAASNQLLNTSSQVLFSKDGAPLRMSDFNFKKAESPLFFKMADDYFKELQPPVFTLEEVIVFMMFLGFRAREIVLENLNPPGTSPLSQNAPDDSPGGPSV